jgi:hypothetical protein
MSLERGSGPWANYPPFSSAYAEFSEGWLFLAAKGKSPRLAQPGSGSVETPRSSHLIIFSLTNRKSKSIRG